MKKPEIRIDLPRPSADTKIFVCVVLGSLLILLLVFFIDPEVGLWFVLLMACWWAVMWLLSKLIKDRL